MSNAAKNHELSLEDTDRFKQDEFLVVESLLDPAYKDRLIAEVDMLVEDRAEATNSLDCPQPLTAYRQLVELQTICHDPRTVWYPG